MAFDAQDPLGSLLSLALECIEGEGPRIIFLALIKQMFFWISIVLQSCLYGF